MSSDFLDEARIFVASGRGGDGYVHFRREKFEPLGGPDGGDGGYGGNVILKADHNLNTLYDFRRKRRFEAEDGMPGSRTRRHGKKADDVIVKVPLGTVVRDDDGVKILVDLVRHGQEFIAVKGGIGGLGNSHFATSTRQSPAFAEKGQPAQEAWLRLELKLVADVGLVGLPNAGKSTLLASMSAARPKIADYPFTTLTPNLGVAALDDYSFVIADIPGLIEGAHAGHGLGDTFLRHIQRTRALVHVVDGSSVDPVTDFDQVSNELRLFDESLVELPSIVAINKMDLPDAQEHAPKLAASFRDRDYEVVKISGVTHAGMPELFTKIRGILESLPARDAPTAEEADAVYRFTEKPNPDHFTVERKRSRLVVHGETVERVVSMTDLESTEAVDHLQRRLKRLGVFQALERQGVKHGDKVVIGDFGMTWEGELEQRIAARAARQDPEPAGKVRKRGRPHRR